jgi:hypothetical protein
MADLVYPTEIPGVTAFDCEPRDRRVLSSDEGGAQQVRGRETDFHGTAMVGWEFTRAQLKIFRDWGRGDLEKWTRKFVVTLPGYLGFVPHVARFLRPPVWDHVGGGYWALNGELELYGRSVNPQYTLLTEIYPSLLGWPGTTHRHRRSPSSAPARMASATRATTRCTPEPSPRATSACAGQSAA